MLPIRFFLTLLCAALVGACVPVPLSIPPQVLSSSEHRHALTVTGAGGAPLTAPANADACTSERDGWRVDALCLTSVSGVFLGKIGDFSVGGTVAFSGHGFTTGPVGRFAIHDSMHHRLTLTAAFRVPAHGTLDVGYAYVVSRKLAFHAQAQAGNVTYPDTYVLYAPLGFSVHSREGLFVTAQVIPGVIGRAEERPTTVMLQAALGVSASWGRRGERAVVR